MEPGRKERPIRPRGLILQATLICLVLGLTTTCWAGRSWWGVVVRVIDGDSIVVRDEAGQDIRVRLIEIDAPELDQPYGKIAAESLRLLIQGHRVRIAPRGKDRNGRLLAEVFSRHGLSLNIHLIESGHAWWFRKYAPECGVCEHEEKKARKQKRGLWALPKPIPPWEWRKNRRCRQFSRAIVGQ